MIKTWLSAILAAFLLALLQTAAGQGLILEEEDKYQSLESVSRYRAWLPPQIDLSHLFPKPGNQGDQGSCVGWAVGYALRSYYRSVTENVIPRGPDIAISPSFIYNQIRSGPDCDSGSFITDALQLLEEKGSVPLATFPYDEGNCTKMPSADLLRQAGDLRINNWKRVEVEHLDDIKGSLMRGRPVIISYRITKEFERVSSDAVYDLKPSHEYTGWHAMVVVGYDENKQAVKVINSWGIGWGDNGFGWISYDTMKKLSRQGFLIEMEDDNYNPLPRPKPKPQLDDFKVDFSGLFERYKCSSLKIIGQPGNLRIVGYVGSKEDHERLQSELPDGLKMNVTVRPWPQCEALRTLAKPLENRQGMYVHVSGEGSLEEKERLKIEIRTPNYPAWIHVTYVQANGDAVHLHRTDLLRDRRIPPGEKIFLGHGNGPRFVVGPPYGDEMLVVTASSSPLFEYLQESQVTEREYLSSLRRAMAMREGKGSQSQVSAFFVPIRTKPKE